MKLEELTHQEKKLVINHRRKQAILLNKELEAIEYVEIAKRFLLFLKSTKHECNYREFCDSFGYIAEAGESRPETWDIVYGIIKLARRRQ